MISTLISVIITWLSGRWSVVSAVCMMVSVLYSIATGTVAMAQELIAQLDAIVQPTMSVSSIGLSPFALANYFFPIDTGIVLFGAYIPFLVTCVTIRIIKSWIPTIG